MIHLFLVFADGNFFNQHSFFIDFSTATRTRAEHSKLSNQALERMKKGAAYLRVFTVKLPDGFPKNYKAKYS